MVFEAASPATKLNLFLYVQLFVFYYDINDVQNFVTSEEYE